MANSIKLTVNQDAILKLIADYEEIIDNPSLANWRDCWRRLFGHYGGNKELEELVGIKLLRRLEDGGYTLTDLGRDIVE